MISIDIENSFCKAEGTPHEGVHDLLTPLQIAQETLGSFAFKISLTHGKPDVDILVWPKKKNRYAIFFLIFDAVLHTGSYPGEGKKRFYERAAVVPQSTGRGHLDNLFYIATKQTKGWKTKLAVPGLLPSQLWTYFLWLCKWKTLCVNIRVLLSSSQAGAPTIFWNSSTELKHAE